MRLHAALLASFLVACAEEPPPRTPRHRPQPPPTGEQDDALARMQAAQDEEGRAMMAQHKESVRTHDDILARAAAEEAAKKKACDDSRPTRVAQVKSIVTERMQSETRLMNHGKAIAAACKIVDRPTGAVTISKSGGGWRVAKEMADDIQCSRPLPAGVTKEDAYVVLWRIRDHGDPVPSGAILEHGDLTIEDARCEALDKNAGLDFDSLRFENIESTKMLTRW